ncbi:MFS transporter [Roseibium litorale]|uniref:MFS transporter n=1 Tax=Roseibium litorale TaxID=2803841 RepID=A0ABR9CQV7_9HYPH|nr:MFS transporter [Roseibium litorale]MBD8893256.1 MFS transporter [Roseibium litorale]
MLTILRQNPRHVLAGVLLTFVSSFGQNFFIAVFGGEIRGSFDLSNGAFGALYTTITIASALTLMVLGRLVDRHSTVLIGALTISALAAASGLVVLAGNVVVLAFALYAVRLMGQGMAPHVSVSSMTQWFPANVRGRALSMASLGNPIGEATLPLAAVAIMALAGWRNTWLTVAILLIAVCLPLFLALTRNLPPARADAGKIQAAPEEPLRPQETARSWTLGELLRNPLLYLLVPGLLSPVIMNIAIFFHQVALTQAKGWDPAWFVAGYPLAAAANIGGSLLTGTLADRIGPLRLLPVVLLPQMAALLAFGSLQNPIGIALYLGFAGMAMGMVMPLKDVLLSRLFGLGHFGSIRSFTTASGVLLGALGPSIIGVLLDTGTSVSALFYAMAGMSAGFALLFLVALPRARRL